jgi:hypothetical protein
MSSRVFYIDSYENLKISSVWVPDVYSMKTRRSTVLGGRVFSALRSLMFIKFISFFMQHLESELLLAVHRLLETLGSRSEPSQRCSIAALVMVCMSSLCSDVRREGPFNHWFSDDVLVIQCNDIPLLLQCILRCKSNNLAALWDSTLVLRGY